MGSGKSFDFTLQVSGSHGVVVGRGGVGVGTTLPSLCRENSPWRGKQRSRYWLGRCLGNPSLGMEKNEWIGGLFWRQSL